MKIIPVATGGTMSAQADTTPVRSPDKVARAKAIAAGQTPEEPVVSSGDLQVDRAQASIKKIKMRTQVSTNRDDVQEPIVEPVETPAPDTVAVNGAEETKPIDPQVAAFLKAKRALQVKEREIAQREEALKTQTVPNPVQPDLMAKLKSNPLSVLQEAGVTYDQLTAAILNDQQTPIDPQKLREEIKEDLKKELFGEFSTRDQQAEQQVLSNIKSEAIGLTSQGEKYEAIQKAKEQGHDPHADIVKLVHTVWKNGWSEKGYEPGHVMDVSEAADLVENQLIEDFTPFARLKKIQGLTTPTPEVQKPLEPKPNTKIMRTLTNRDTASPTLDRRARAIAAMNGTLRKG